MTGATLLRGLPLTGSLALLPNCAQDTVSGKQHFVLMSGEEEGRMDKRADAEVHREYGVSVE